MNNQEKKMKHVTLDTIGKRAATTIQVELSTRFLEHFSKQLYSSPQKAFEELISNGWDAGASIVNVHVATDLQVPDAMMAVFDNGTSMDEAGLRALWHIAFSPKEGQKTEYGRPLIGKFGIGKLATYVLAERLTYICKADDGVIRRVTMNYGDVDKKGAGSDQLINNLTLNVFELRESELAEALEEVCGGNEILKLVNGESLDDQKVVNDEGEQDEFGGVPAELNRSEYKTWTLVVLSDLKRTGRDLKLGILRRMLAAALPFGTEMSIFVNGTRLKSTKLEAPLVKQWVIGPDLGIDSIKLDEANGGSQEDESDALSSGGEAGDVDVNRQILEIKSGQSPYPYVELPEVGRVTGLVRLFEDKISGGKSEERGASNGFYVNVLGRIVNQHDPSLGEENLNHATWARFRMSVRADGLNEFLTINREQFTECRGMKIFRAFLRSVFNNARKAHDSGDKDVGMPANGDALVESLGVLSLSPLRNVVSEALRTQPAIPELFDESGIEDREEKRQSWWKHTAEKIQNALEQVKYEELDDDSFVKFKIQDNSIVVNKEHPFVLEHSGSKAEKELVRMVAMVDLLADVYALDIGIEPRLLERVRGYRDKLMRFRTLKQRKSGILIAQLLQKTQHDSTNWKNLEAVVGDALRHLGFEIKQLGKSGEPEGIATAVAIPTSSEPTAENQRPPLYSFSFDAKSSKHRVVKTGNISLDAAVEHRKRYHADYALVIAPGFSDGALVTRCGELKVTPMTTGDLGKLLKYTVKYGAIPVNTFRKVFEYFDPKGVSTWVEGLDGTMEANRKLTIDVFIKALDELKDKVPDALAASTVALTCRESLGVVGVLDVDVIALVKGLQVMIPDLVGIDGDKIIVNASATSVAATIKSQLEKLPGDEDIHSE